jgi:hypothetical protein
VIGLAAVVQRPSPRSEVIEGTLALVALAAMTGFIIWLPREPWETVFPITWLFPILLWLAARCRPAFSAMGAFVVSITIVWTTILGIGNFGDPSRPIADRVMGAQAGILVVAFSAYFLAALFAERRESATRLAHSYTMLEHERDNKLMNAQAIVAAVAHEVRQPLNRGMKKAIGPDANQRRPVHYPAKCLVRCGARQCGPTRLCRVLISSSRHAGPERMASDP